MEDSEIIILFNERSEKAIVELSKKYGKLCLGISERIVGNRSDAEECVNDAYLGVWNTVPPEEPESLSAYTCKIVRNLSMKKLRYNTSEKRNSGSDVCLDEVEDYIFDTEEFSSDTTDDAVSDCINEFLASLSEKDRLILMGRYWNMDSYAEIAKTAGISVIAVRTRMSRIKSALKKYLISRGVIK